MLDRACLLSTIPAIFTGEERKVIEDWIMHSPMFQHKPEHAQAVAEFLADKSPVTRVCGMLIDEHISKLTHRAIDRARAAGISERDIAVGLLRVTYGSIFAQLKQRRSSVSDLLSIIAALADESAASSTKLLFAGALP